MKKMSIFYDYAVRSEVFRSFFVILKCSTVVLQEDYLHGIQQDYVMQSKMFLYTILTQTQNKYC